MQGTCLVLFAVLGFAAAQVQLNLEFEYLNKFANVKVRIENNIMQLSNVIE